MTETKSLSPSPELQLYQGTHMVYQCEQCQAGVLLASGGQGGPPQARNLEPRPEGGREQILWGEQNLLLENKCKYIH